MTRTMKLILFVIILHTQNTLQNIPLVINTWGFKSATQKAWQVLQEGEVNNQDSALDALTAGCKTCQDEQCDTTVGYGGSPDENGETTLDAIVFDGDSMDMGAVGGIRRIKNVISVARHVLENTEHSFLVGSLATDFATKFGFPDESLQTNFSLDQWRNWKENKCQPNFWKNVQPDPKATCGPYKVSYDNSISQYYQSQYNSKNHDTIGMIVISGNGHIVAGTSTNGAKFKIPGRVGDSPIPGAGAYADSRVGAAAATGDGDIMMRFLPSFLAVEKMREGASPSKAASIAISRIAEKYPSFFGGIIVVDKKGNIGAACNGMDTFPFTLANEKYPQSIVKYVVKCEHT
ncbi:N(4)-(Beta-N-acetylglucosaminyl)-L-asparaginase [Leptinotarsa decemlineata]|uniref:N(4)-(Beta-N-acetylglucosaminyl)-L-asparaginase n=1 Tax=Leptinotarsa decemlineata TaxID=7539 RepID=UPI000C254C42|nr:N(4)-(Beta-N-acetylglucosaminyl)-L-asparaginase-like [Leptinotarsa decemlineata]XP_023014176.1 N(4)-(Beta-N-acetylglucosaminyl)-L-asparaginase-like [Leptinotarsa decemlineata]XP_023014184.1 N(4)-(Beta-N-acetylglucosaminyl)-L-asparaginase-like [Leptinotarsa decemlineata]XP_023014191.1 N(4)-(Beta-N-acetylglucosaminyl)-L-asparaginase-like [Leptinotarsa decemlineata]